MAGKVGQATAAAAVSTGGSLISDAKLKQLYATMVRCRLLTERACRLRGQPRSAGLYAASMGQEAIATGCAIDLLPEDTIALAPQNAIAGLVKGVPLAEIAAQIYGAPLRTASRPTSSCPRPRNARSLGWRPAWPLPINGRRKATWWLLFTGKATTALGCWHEALELAAGKTLPIIFVVEDNPWTDPASLKASGDEEDPSDTSTKLRLSHHSVDANDVVAVYRVAYESVERVRQGGGPVLVEGKPYRLTRPNAALQTPQSRSERDPLTHMERYLKAKGLFTRDWKDSGRARVFAEPGYRPEECKEKSGKAAKIARIRRR